VDGPGRGIRRGQSLPKRQASPFQSGEAAPATPSAARAAPAMACAIRSRSSPSALATPAATAASASVV
jgi:hypothetical protein